MAVRFGGSGGGITALTIGAGATSITGGTAGRVLIEGAGPVLADSADLTFASGVLTVGGTTAGAGIVVTGGTITADSQRISITETRNNAGVTFGGAIKVVITDTASATGSLAMQILGGAAGTTNLLKLDKTGTFEVANNIVTAQNIGYLASAGSTAYNLAIGGGAVGVLMVANYALRWNSQSSGAVSVFSGGTNDTSISRLSAGLVSVDTTTIGNFAGRLKLTSAIAAGVAVGSLNASPTTGEIQSVTDALNPVDGSAVAAGGSAKALVWYNGTQWTVIGV